MPTPEALDNILGTRMILSGGDITKMRCFLVGLVTGDNWQNGHGEHILKKMTGDDLQYGHGKHSHRKMTGGNGENDHGDNSDREMTRDD
jgi:hypothetical protein